MSRYPIEESYTHCAGKFIITEFVYPPIPLRNFDWSAVTDDYDGADIDENTSSRDPIGWGATEAEAIADLKQQLSENEP